MEGKGKPGETTTVVIVTSAVFAKTTAVTIDYDDDKSARAPNSDEIFHE